MSNKSVVYKGLHSKRGMSLVGLLVAIALFVTVFVGLLSAFQTIVEMISRQKSSSGALALANERMEYIRSLSYNSIGTIGGIVSGPIPQISTTTLNGVTYIERVDVRYFDDEADGVGVADTNTITADYKVVKVEYSWDEKGIPKTLSLVSNIVPNGMETLVGGGTLIINVFDALTQPVPGAAVTIINNTTTSTINTTVYTNANGQAMLPGAPAAAQYELSVTKLGYSTDATYSATGTNANPNPPHVAVVESGISTVSFSIDEVSTMQFTARETPTYGDFFDSFNDTSLLSTWTDTGVFGGKLVLENISGVYDASGTAYATVTAPLSLHRWLSINLNKNVPAGTSMLARVYSVNGAGTYTIIPDSDIPGNSAGLSGDIIDIRTLATSTYPRIALMAELSTSNTAMTPEVNEWSIEYEASVTPTANVAIDVAGTKTIGSAADLSPILKHATTTTTNSGGVATLVDMEWDSYTVSINGASEGYDIAEACPNIPLAHNPGIDSSLLLTLVPDVGDSLRVSVTDNTGSEIAGAQVTLDRAGYNATQNTSLCGQVFFGPLTAASDYQLTIVRSGYTTEILTNVSVSGVSQNTVILSP